MITSIPNRVKILQRKFVNSLGLTFRDLLPKFTIQEALDAEKIILNPPNAGAIELSHLIILV